MKKIRGVIVVLLAILSIPLFWACLQEKNLLKTPQNVSLDESTNILTWDLVKDAEFYGIDINGKVYQTKETFFDISLYTEDSGIYTIKVKAFSITDGKKTSNFSQPISLVKKARLASPKLIFDSKTGELSWQSIENASYYIMVINGVYYSTTEHNFNLFEQTPFDNHLIRGQENTFKVYCAPTSNYLGSQFSKEIKTYIANIQQAPQNVSLEIIDGRYIYSFDRVSTATNYEISINNRTFSTASSQNDLNMYLRSFGTITIFVQASEVKDADGNILYMKSPKSQELQFEYKPDFIDKSVQNIEINEEKVLTFDAILNAKNYEITIDGVKYTSNTNSFNLAELLVDAKRYDISVVAVNGTYKSLAGTIQYDNIIKLQSPEFEFVEPEESMVVERHINIITQYSIPVAYYVCFTNGYIETRQNQNIDITDYLEIGENEISVQVVCGGEEFYEDSDLTTKTYNYYLSTMPTNLQINNQKVLTFSGTESITETYKIYVKLQNQQWGEAVITTQNTTIDLNDYIVNVGKYNIGVSIVNNGIEGDKAIINYVISQELSPPQSIVAVQETDGRVLLSFDEVANATGYVLYIDDIQKCQLDNYQFNDITNYVNIGSDTNISLKAVGDNEVYLASETSNVYIFKYIKQLDLLQNVYVEANLGKYYLYFEPIENIYNYQLTISAGSEETAISINAQNFDDLTGMFIIDIDNIITNTDDYDIEISANIDESYYLQTPYQSIETIRVYNQEEYSTQTFFYYGKYYSYSINSEFELGEAVLHAMLYRKDNIEVYLNYDYEGIEDAYTLDYSPIQNCLPVINNFGVDLDSTSSVFAQLFLGSGSLQNKIQLIERAHDQMYLYITGESYLTSQKSNRVYTIEFDYSKAGKYQADESNLEDLEPDYIGQTTSKTFPIDSYQEVEVENVNQLIMIVCYGKKPKFINQDDIALNHIAEDTYNSARYILSQICNDSMSEVEIVKAIHDWIVVNNTYDYSTFEAASGAPFDCANLSDMGFFASGTLLKNLSVCAGYAQTFSLMCGIMGIRSSVTLGLVGNGISWQSVDFNNYFSLITSGLASNMNDIGAHSWNRVYISTPQYPEKAWYIVDCTWDDYDDGVIRYEYFLKTDADENVSSSRKELYPNGTYYHEYDDSGVEIDYSATAEYNMQ